MGALFLHLACQGLAICPSVPRHSHHLILLRSEIPSNICAKLRTVAASNNRDHACNLSYYCLLALHIWCYSSRTCRSWWITQSTQHHRRGCNNIPSFLQRTTPIARSLCDGWTPHGLHILATAPFCWCVSHSVTHKHERWIWFTLSYAMMKALLRLAAVRDTKQAGELRGDTTLYCLEFCTVFYDAKQQHLSTIKTDGDLSFTIIQQQTYGRKQLMDQADDNWLTALLMKRERVRFREVANTCTERWAEKRIQRTAWILNHVLRKTLCEHVNGLRPAGWLNEQCITKHWFQSVRTCPYSWATGRNTNLNLRVTSMR